MIYTAPSDATSETVVDFSNVEIFANGVSEAIAKPEFIVDGVFRIFVEDVNNDNAIKLINDVMESAIGVQASKSKHSFCIHFSVLTEQDASSDLNVSLAGLMVQQMVLKMKTQCLLAQVKLPRMD